MGESSTIESESHFGRLLVEQGLVRQEHLDECLGLLRRLQAEGVSPLPRLAPLLLQKGYLTLEQYNETLRVTPRGTPSAGAASPAAVPADVARAAENPDNVAGKYVRVVRLGAGGMGEVWKAWDRELGRWVALKFLKGRDPDEVARFQREAQTAARLSHPNIAAVYDVGENGGRPYIAMQLIEGQTLTAIADTDRRRLVTLVRDAALAVHHAHEQGVIHRDLKPQNIMVEARSSGDRVFVMDFGLAKQTSLESSLSVSGSIVGTPAYMPPEQARGRLEEIDVRSDVYSLGATLYDLLAGRPPFEGSDVYDLLKKVVGDEPRRLRAIVPRTDTDLETMVAKCLEKERERRYATARDLADDLTRFLEGEPIAARPASVAYRLKKRILKNTALSIAIAAAVLVAIVATIVVAAGAVRRAEERAREEARRQIEREASDLCAQATEKIKEAKALLRIRASKQEQWEALFTEAHRIAESAIQKYPDLGASYLAMGEIQEARGRWREAIQSLDQALARNETLADAWRRRGICHLEIYAEEVMLSLSSRGRVWVVSETSEARRVREEPPKKASLESLARYTTLKGLAARSTLEERCLLAAISIGEGRYAEAEEACEKLLDEVSTEERVWLVKAAAQHAQGKYDAALKTLDTLISDVLPHDSRTRLMRAWTRTRLGDWPGAFKDCQAAIRLDPRSSRAHLLSAMAKANLMDPFGALNDLNKAIELDPASPYGYAVRARAKSLFKDWDGAVKDATLAVDRNPFYSGAYFYRGLARKQLGDLDNAVADFSRALELDPKDEAVLGQFVGAKLAKGDRAGLLRMLDRLIEQDAGDAFLYYQRARVRSDAGEFAASVADYDKAISLRPGQASYHYFRGTVRIQLGAWDAAEVDLVRAIELDPKNAWAHAHLGHVKIHRGDQDEALRQCDEAVRLSPDDSTLYPVRGRVRLARKEYAKALEDFQKAVSLWDHLAAEVAPLIAECRKNLPP